MAPCPVFARSLRYGQRNAASALATGPRGNRDYLSLLLPAMPAALAGVVGIGVAAAVNPAAPAPEPGPHGTGVTPGGAGSSPGRRVSGAMRQDRWGGVSVVSCVGAEFLNLDVEFFDPAAGSFIHRDIGLAFKEFTIELERIDGVHRIA